MRTGGIFGDGALGIVGGGVFGQSQASGLGLVGGGVFGRKQASGLGAVDLTPYCGAAFNLGAADRKAGRSSAPEGVVSRIGLDMFKPSQDDETYIQGCYLNGWSGKTRTGTTVTDDTVTSSFVGPMPDTGAGKPCTDQSVIASVQGQIGVNADGKWGPVSQAALTKLGRTFKSFAPDCKEPVPYYGGTGGKGGTTTSDLTTAPPSYQGAGMQKWSSSPVFWAVMLAAGVGGYLYLTSGKKGKL